MTIERIEVDWDVLVSASNSCLRGYAPGFVEYEIVERLPASTTYRLWQSELGELGTVEIRKLRDGLSQIQFSGLPYEESETFFTDEVRKKVKGLNGDKRAKIYSEFKTKYDERASQRLKKKEEHLDNVRKAYFSRLSQEDIFPEPALINTGQSASEGKGEKPTIENTRIQTGRYDDLCIRWVNRPYIPKQNKDEFLSEYEGELNKKTFDRILKDAYKRKVIDKINGRYTPKTVS